MPNLDGSGPEGKGPLTGRRRGKCLDKEAGVNEKNQSPENEDVVYGIGRGGKPFGGGGRGRGRGRFGRGHGFGWGRRFENQSSKNVEQ